MTMFVSIAAYRDQDLVPTIEHALATARWPNELRFAICWQHGEGETPPPKLGGGRMRVIDVPWRESRGACWARAELMKLYNGEEYFLQLDSHHRFAEHWDAVLFDQAERSGSAKPLLTTYGRPFTPTSPLPPPAATAIAFKGFRPEGSPNAQTWLRPDWAERDRPARARFLSAHLLFAAGSFVSEVPYDPELYFFGEEITLAIRAFTHGYDLFHPVRHVLWHEDPRRTTPLHWDDHVPTQGFDVTAAARDAASLAKVSRFLTQHPVGDFACGTARGFTDYERYAGLDFRRRTATRETVRGDDPLAPPPAGPLPHWRLRIDVPRAALPPGAIDAPRFWYVGFHDAENVEIAREDADHAELVDVLTRGGERVVIERQVRSLRPPARWTLWPVDRRGNWTECLSGPAAPERLG